jgi:hypothetical protein
LAKWRKTTSDSFQNNSKLELYFSIDIEILSKSQKLVATQKEKLNTMKNKHTSALPGLQQLDITKRSLESECEILFL